MGVAQTDPDDKSPPTLDEIRREPTAYLIGECEMEREYKPALKRHDRDIFEHELAGWYTVEDAWPENRSFAVFQQWFDFLFVSMVYDFADEPLMLEELA